MLEFLAIFCLPFVLLFYLACAYWRLRYAWAMISFGWLVVGSVISWIIALLPTLISIGIMAILCVVIYVVIAPKLDMINDLEGIVKLIKTQLEKQFKK